MKNNPNNQPFQSDSEIQTGLILPTKFNLTPTDIEKYRRKFITAKMLKQEGRRRVNDFEAGEILNSHNNSGYRSRHKNLSGIVYIYRTFFDPDDSNRPRQYRVRRDKPDLEEKKGELKEKGKYLSAPGAQNMLYVPLGVKIEWLKDVSIPVVCFEGEDKALAAARVASKDFSLERWKFIPIALAGVWNFRTKRTRTDEYGEKIEYKGLLIDFDFFEWIGRKTTLLFDVNVYINKMVKRARRAFGEELQAFGASVYFVDLPEKYKNDADVNGFDDYLALIANESGSDTTAIEAGMELINSAYPANEKKSKENQATQILNFAKNLKLFHTADQDCYATIEIDGHEENHRLDSKSFGSWLSFQFFKSEGLMPQAQALKDAIRTLKGFALFECEEREVFIRLASLNGTIYLDLCNKDWQIIEIDKNGWRIIESKNALVKFRRAKGMLPLPMPPARGDITKIRRFLNVNDSTYTLMLAWLVNCFRPDYPFPINILNSEQGSGKSTTTKVLRNLVDPNKTSARSAPRNERDLVIAANNSWILAFDNLSRVPDWLSDALCRISTGGGFGARTLYENDEETIFAAKRPILINGIGDLAHRGDFLDRSLLNKLKAIPEDKRKTETEFWDEFEKEKPGIFSGLLTAVSVALRELDNISLARVPRMADFAHWVVAAEKGLGLPDGAFLKAYVQNRDDVNDTALEGVLLAETVRAFCNKNSSFLGTMKEFLTKLNQFADDETKKQKEYPKTARGLRSKLERINPNLRAIGIDIKFLEKSEKGRLVQLENKRKQPSGTSDSQDALQTKDLTADGMPDGSNRERQTVSQQSANHQGSNVKNYNGLDITPDGSDGSDGWIQDFSNGQSQKKSVDEVI